MRVITNKHIDLTNYVNEDLKIDVTSGGSLVMQCVELGSTLTISGRNVTATATTPLLGISNTFSKVSSVNADGIYTYDVSGIDYVMIEVEGNTGDVYIKVVD